MNLMSIATNSFSKYRKISNALGDGLRPCNFRGQVILPPPLLDLQDIFNSRSILLKEISLPETSLKTVKTSIYGREIAIPVMLNTNNEVELTFYIDDALITRDVFDFWMRCMDKTLSTKEEMYNILGGIISKNTQGGWENFPGSHWDSVSVTNIAKKAVSSILNRILGSSNEGTPQYFTGEIRVQTLDNMNVRTSNYVFKNVYPLRVSQVKLDSSEAGSIGTVSVNFYYTHCLRGDMTLIDSIKEMTSDQFST